jgi:hypothetical protein
MVYVFIARLMSEWRTRSCAVSPANLTARILNHLSIDPSQTYHDEFQKLDRPLSVGHVVRGLGAIARAGSEIRAQPSQAGRLSRIVNDRGG